jgi:transcriptional regulator with XRE-family HTH domain
MATTEEIGKRVREAREEMGMTQGDLGRRWGGRSHAAVSDIERGTTRLTASGLAELAQILNKPVTFFYGEKTSAQYLRGGRDEDGAISSRPGAEDFRKFLLQKKKEREGE